MNHDLGLLVKKLFFYGIRGSANAWLNNYFTNINQHVIADDHSPDMGLITGYHKYQYWVQFFLLYNKDICNVSNVLKFV